MNLFILLFFMQLSAVAETNSLAVQICDNYPTTVNGFGITKSSCLNKIAGKAMNDLAVQICDKYPTTVNGFGITKLSCLNKIAGKAMNDLAVQICDKYPTTVNGFGITKLSCLNKIAGKAMNDSDVQACDKYPTTVNGFGTTKLSCLNKIEGEAMADLTFQSSETPPNLKQELPNNSSPMEHTQQSRQAINEVIEFCRKDIVSYKRNDCMNTVVTAQFIDTGAFDLCKKQPHHKQVECLLAIVNKEYYPSLIEECAEELSHNQAECLSRYGTSINNQNENHQAYNSRQAINEVIEFCRKDIVSYKRNDCMNTVVTAQFIDTGAFDLCKKQPHHKQVECLLAIVNKEYYPSLIEECAEELSHNQAECLSRYGTSINNQNENHQAYNSRQAINEVIEFCRKDIVSYKRNDCMNTVVTAQFIDTGAFDLCKKQPHHKQVECLLAIVNKEYYPSLIEECAEESSHNQAKCLSRYGASINNQKDQLTVIVIQQGLSECKYENFHGLYPEGGGCNFHGCWIAGGGCNFHGCWYPKGSCDFRGCVNEAPTDNICQ